MIAKRYYSDTLPISLREIVYSYNSSCPSFCTYEHYRSIPYILSSTILLEILIKKILLLTDGKYRGVHVPSQLITHLSESGFPIREFTEEEESFLDLDHSYLRYNWTLVQDQDIREELVDGLFEYFLDLAVKLGVE